MVKYKGRLGFKQYMPMKPVKWVPADATNGFVSTMQVYTQAKMMVASLKTVLDIVSFATLWAIWRGKIITSFAIIFSLQFDWLKIDCPANSIFVEQHVPIELTFLKT